MPVRRSVSKSGGQERVLFALFQNGDRRIRKLGKFPDHVGDELRLNVLGIDRGVNRKLRQLGAEGLGCQVPARIGKTLKRIGIRCLDNDRLKAGRRIGNVPQLPRRPTVPLKKDGGFAIGDQIPCRLDRVVDPDGYDLIPADPLWLPFPNLMKREDGVR